MGLIKCPDCGHMVSDRAAACPSCGCPADAFGEAVPYVPENTSAEPDLATQIGCAVAYPMYRSFDREDLMLANQAVIEHLKPRLSCKRPVTFFSLETCDLAEKIVNHEFSFPYVFVTSSFRYYLDYRRFTLTKADGRTVTRYYNPKILPSEYAPRIEVISDNEAEVLDLTEKIKNIFKVPLRFTVPFLGGKDEYLTFDCEIESVNMTNDIYSGGKTRLLHKTVIFKMVPWASYIDEEINPCKNGSMRLLRDLQYAQFCLLYSSMKDRCDGQLSLYEGLFGGKTGGSFWESPTDEYKILKKNVQSGQPFESDLVDKAFPNISLVYHELPNDIHDRTSAEAVRKRVYEVLDRYRDSWEKACISSNLPNDFLMYGRTVSLRDNDGLLYLIESLEANVMRTIDDILEEIKAKVTQMYLDEQRQAREDAYYESRYSSGRSSIIGDILKTAAGVALGNKISGNTDKDKK